ncbi:MFS transporter [Trueperella bernardiae]|uniref:MFS transporter n=1 Tax=Trueperella bernardiae TaxID=59561 RepID=UPI000C7CBF49|nr:MFS transporter [Trueperella bernardiae]PKZ88703.1 MFS transporter [Trueperella bernardiae]
MAKFLDRNPITRLILPIYLPALIFAIGSGTVIPVLALAALDVGFDEAGSSAAVGVLGFVSIVFSPLLGKLIARIGDKSALIAGSGAALVALGGLLWTWAYPGTTPSRAVFVLAIALLAVGSNSWSLARQAYLAESIPPMWRARGLSTLGGMIRIGQLIGPLVATALLTAWALQSVFIFNILLIFLALALIVAYVVPDPAAERKRVSAGQSEEGSRGLEHRSKLATIILGIGINCLNVLRANRSVIVPLWGTFLGFQPTFVTATFAVTALLDTLMFIVSGSLMDRRGRHWALLPSLVFMPIGIVVMILWTTPLGFVVGAAILGFGNGFGAGIVMTMGADLSPITNRAAFLGIWQSIVAIGTAAGPFVVSGMTAAVSLRAGLWATVAIGAFGLIWCAALVPVAYRRLGTDLRGMPL